MHHSAFFSLVLLTSSTACTVLAWPSSYQHSNSSNCAAACSELAREFPTDLYYPNTTQYIAEQVYWSQQQSQTLPSCRIAPKDAQTVSQTLRVLRDKQCQFAVRSGGHGSFKGASNIDSGVTIDLAALKSLEISKDRKFVTVGTGNRWEDIYSQLDAVGLAVVGGRNGDIGAGGLTLGGGISFFSGFHGWACDNVEFYEVVLADGRIAHVSPDSFSDLYFALRGGGNNFGVVTRLGLRSFDQGLMWGGSTLYSISAAAAIYDATYWFTRNHADDPKAALIAAAACAGAACFFSNNYDYAAPVREPPPFANFTAIANISDTSRIAPLSDLTAEIKSFQPNGFRQAFFTTTFRACEGVSALMLEVNKIWLAEIAPIQNISSFVPSLVMQPLSLPIIEKFAQNGGNALGISEADGPLIIMNMDFQWGSTADDAHVLAIMQRILDRANALAEAAGLAHRYRYQNYAYITQDVFASYGPESKARLLDISKKFDPEAVFQKLQPGYFKLEPRAG